MEWDNNFDLVLNSFISLLFWGQSFYILIYYAGFGMKSRCTFLSVELTPIQCLDCDFTKQNMNL